MRRKTKTDLWYEIQDVDNRHTNIKSKLEDELTRVYSTIEKLEEKIRYLSEYMHDVDRKLPRRDKYLTALLADEYIDKVVVLKDKDTRIIGKCTGINDVFVNEPIFEIEGKLREGIPVEDDAS